MPAMSFLEFAADETIVTTTGNLIAVGCRIHLHARLRKLRVDASLVRVPEQCGRSNQNLDAGLPQLARELSQPISHLAAEFEPPVAAWLNDGLKSSHFDRGQQSFDE